MSRADKVLISYSAGGLSTCGTFLFLDNHYAVGIFAFAFGLILVMSMIIFKQSAE